MKKHSKFILGFALGMAFVIILLTAKAITDNSLHLINEPAVTASPEASLSYPEPEIKASPSAKLVEPKPSIVVVPNPAPQVFPEFPQQYAQPYLNSPERYLTAPQQGPSVSVEGAVPASPLQPPIAIAPQLPNPPPVALPELSDLPKIPKLPVDTKPLCCAILRPIK